MASAAHGKADEMQQGVALNSVTPAQAGTLVTVLMIVAIIPAATVTGVLAAAAVEKLFFAVIGTVVFGYLFPERRRLVRAESSGS